MRYRIEVKNSASREIQNLPPRDRHRVMAAISLLADEPRPQGVRKLAGSRGAYRIRVGDYRIVYQIEDGVLLVYVVRVAHRREVYRGL